MTALGTDHHNGQPQAFQQGAHRRAPEAERLAVDAGHADPRQELTK